MSMLDPKMLGFTFLLPVSFDTFDLGKIFCICFCVVFNVQDVTI